MGRKCCQPNCYACCLDTHKAIMQQLEYMCEEALSNRQDFMVYLLNMARCEAQMIVDCAIQQAQLQKNRGWNTEHTKL